MKKCGPVVKESNMPDVNFNTPCMKNEKTGNKSPMNDKILGTILEPHGASSGEMFAQADGPASLKVSMPFSGIHSYSQPWTLTSSGHLWTSGLHLEVTFLSFYQGKVTEL